MEKDKFTQLRRKDRAVHDDDWIVDLISSEPMGYMSSVSGDQPFLHVTTFYYDIEQHAIYMHTAGKGHTRDTIEKNPNVSFCVATMGRMLPSKYAREMSVEFSSIMAYGKAEILTEVEEGSAMMSKLVEKYFKHLKEGTDYRPITDKEMKEISVIKISIDSWVGKAKKEVDDFPGAFDYQS